MSDQCALNSSGQLKDASDLDFYDSESDEKALPPVPSALAKGSQTVFTEYLAAENADEDGNPLMNEEEDEDFEMPALQDVSDSEDDDSDSENEGVGNDEVQQLADLLSSKAVPTHGGVRSSKPQTRHKPSVGKRKQSEESVPALPAKEAPRVTVVEVKDEDNPPKLTVNFQFLHADSYLRLLEQYKNPIYLFYGSG
ncbi:hypothetical protein B0H16DRAFT_1734162 [Mycena metata]|uniref:Uncharacterized protein n=1 Tax=Mycena metata TaxID=1033252 RepID=A0AAD7HXN8_9AGAR|nr:hypothetical protein B0H16DRAFT_1734162 [Mycena metata]